MLGSLGGYPGSTSKTFFFFVQKLFLMPTDLSENLFGFSLLPILLLALLSFLGFRVMISIIASALIVISPFVLYPESGFLLANKALFYVALISFTLSYFMDRISLRNRGFAVTVLLFIFIPLSFGAIYKTRDAREAIICLSENYKKASEEILDNRNEKILIVGGYSYFFSNLEDIYTKMMKTSFPHIVSISDIMFLPYMSSFDFDKVIVTKDFDLNPGRAVMSSVDIVKGIEARKFIERELGVYERKISLPPPHVDFIPASDHLKIDIIDPRIGTYVRCLRMESYIGCYPIPPKYTFRYNKVKKIEKIDIIYISGEGEMSQPVTFNKFR